MSETYLHLSLPRLEPTNARRKGSNRSRPKPENAPAQAQHVLNALQKTAREAESVQPGFDPRLLVKLDVEGISPEQLESALGVKLVSQEDKFTVVVFVDEKARSTFEMRLREIVRGREPSYKDVLYAIKGASGWHREDRYGLALQREGFPSTPTFLLDIELWPLELHNEREALLREFKSFCQTKGIRILDSLSTGSVVLVRVRTDEAGANLILSHRDVRTVDLPPTTGLERRLVQTSISDIAAVPQADSDAPRVAILDSGIATNHPLLAPASGEAASFLAGRDAADEHGHGTLVGGLALYGDVAACAERRSFIPELWLLSGRLTNEHNEVEGLIEKQLVQAVDYFNKNHQCRIFNISLGNRRKPYLSGHIGPWASVLDELARTHQVLFVVSAGNFIGTETIPSDWIADYPNYLLSEDARLIDPASALNALTVGSVARYDLPRQAQTFPNDPRYQPIARIDEPSPFTRSGPSIRNAIKPELVEYGGNLYVDGPARSRARGHHDLGEMSTSSSFAGGNLFAVDCGTSYAAPKVTHLAGRLLAKYPQASPNLLRALIVAHASVPQATRDRMTINRKKPNSEDAQRTLCVAGYGRPNADAALNSTERRVTLISESHLGVNQYHFYEVPLPPDFLKAPSKRPRRITVSLAHTPLVRRTRLEYAASSFSFRLIKHESLEYVIDAFKRTDVGVDQGEMPKDLKEPASMSPKMTHRSKGTVQAATCEIKTLQARHWEGKKLIVVVERRVPEWGKNLVQEEPYALTVVLEDRSDVPVQLYSQARVQIQLQQRARIRT